jgi:serine/threonine-protein kinase
MRLCPICDVRYPKEKTVCDVHHIRLIDSGELDPGSVIRSKFQIVRTLGRGGMGVVYEAQNILNGRRRALKFLTGDAGESSNLFARFRQEAQIDLRHPNIVEVIDAEQSENGSLYIVMEFVDGPSLERLLESSSMPIEGALAIARGVGEGLAAAHAQGVLHRDVKPSNILMHQGKVPKLADFGIASMRESPVPIATTKGMIGTPHYASPEQFRGMTGAQMDGRVDIYALGCVLYHMLTGRPPFDRNSYGELAEAHLRGERVPPSRFRPEIAQWVGLDALVLRALAVDREQRAPDLATFLRDLDAVRKRPQETVVEQPAPASRAKTVWEARPEGERSNPERPAPQSTQQKAEKQKVRQQTTASQVGRAIEKTVPDGTKIPKLYSPWGARYRIIGNDGQAEIGPWPGFAAMCAGILPAMFLNLMNLLDSNAAPWPAPYLVLIACTFLVLGGVGWIRYWNKQPGLRLYYQSKYREDLAKRVHASIVASGCFKAADGKTIRTEVWLTELNGQPMITFVLKQTALEDEKQLQILAAVTRLVAPVAGQLPMMMQAADSKLFVRKRLLVF